MSGSLSKLFISTIALLLAATALFAAPPVAPTSGIGGVQVSLNTSAYRLMVNPGQKVVSAEARQWARENDAKVAERNTFQASAVIFNRSSTDIHLPGAANAANPIKFRIINSAGAVLWNSDPEPLLPDAELLLPQRSQWRRNVAVPLAPGGLLLAPGTYQLEMNVESLPSMGARSVFEVVWLPDDSTPAGNQGIAGEIFQKLGYLVTADGDFIAPTAFPPRTPAAITIEEIRPAGSTLPGKPFALNTQTDQDGRFKIATPEGTFLIKAKRVLGVGEAVDGHPELGTGQLQVVVKAGQFAPATIYLAALVTYAPPRTDTGIRGRVVAGSAPNASSVAGATVRVQQYFRGRVVPWIAPRASSVAGATVQVQQDSPTAGSISLWPLFSATGITDADGRFQINTRPGTYEVFLVDNASGLALEAAVETGVSVQTNNFTEVTVVKPAPLVTP